MCYFFYSFRRQSLSTITLYPNMKIVRKQQRSSNELSILSSFNQKSIVGTFWWEDKYISGMTLSNITICDIAKITWKTITVQYRIENK